MSRRTLLTVVISTAVLLVLSISAECVFYSEAGGTRGFALKWMSLPVFVSLLMVSFRTAVMGKETAHKVINSIIVTVFLCGLCGNALMWINALPGNQNSVAISGIISAKSRGGIKGYRTITVYDNQLRRSIRLSVSRSEYELMQVGQPYCTQMRNGIFGILYVWAGNRTAGPNSTEL